MACAQTGSGKTAGFLFPCISTLLRNGPRNPDNLPNQRNTQSYYSRRKMYPGALILAPTRELASQIYQEAQKFCYRTGLRPVVVYGGARIDNQWFCKMNVINKNHAVS